MVRDTGMPITEGCIINTVESHVWEPRSGSVHSNEDRAYGYNSMQGTISKHDSIYINAKQYTLQEHT